MPRSPRFPTLLLFAAATLLLSGSRVAAAQLSVAVSGSPAPMTIVAAAAGADLAPVIDNTTTITVTAKLKHGATARITAQLDANMPAGTTLSAVLSGPGSSAGTVNLDATPRTLATGIGNLGSRGATGTITYTFTATAAAGVIPPAMRTVILTIVSP